ncbi:hypothetical protein LguiA_003207 [Lonicera macranthoides]
MERPPHVQKAHASTADLLTWTEAPPSDAPTVGPGFAFHSGARSHQPSEGIRKVLSGQITDEEAESLNRRKPCSGYKLKEISGSKIFAVDGEDGVHESGTAKHNPDYRTSVRIVQQAVNGISQISFSTDEDISPKKPISLPEVAKQRELSGTLESESDSKNKKQLSNAKSKELSGNDIFGPPPEIPHRSSAAARSLESKGNKEMDEPAPRSVHTSVRVSNPAGGHSSVLFSEEPVTKTTKKIHDQKFAELTGNDIFKGDIPPGSAEKPLSVAKLREMSGSNIFADGKVKPRGMGGVRKPPGGESSIALI